MEKTLDTLAVGKTACITDITLEEPKYFKAIHLGLVKGHNIKCVFKSPFKDPIAYQIKGCVFALRKSDAKKVKVKYDG